MKFKGKVLAERFKFPHEIHREDGTTRLLLVGLPLGWESDIRNNFLLEPEPPTRAIRDSKSGMHAKDAEGKVRFEPDENDPGYLVKANVWWKRLRGLIVYKMLTADPDFEFELEEPKTGQPADWEKFADAINQGFEENHFTDAELGTIASLSGYIAGAQKAEKLYSDFLLTLDGKKGDETANQKAS